MYKDSDISYQHFLEVAVYFVTNYDNAVLM